MLIDHEDGAGLMPAMTMSFAVPDEAVLAGLATSMFGLWELRVPAWAQRASGGRSGAFGAFGWSGEASDRIYDTMQHVRPNVATTCTGLAASMGAVLLCAGEPGKRFALPHSRVMVHQPSGGYQGQVTDIHIHAQEVLELKRRLNQIMSKHTGQPIERIEQDLERDNFMSAEQSVTYGIIDKVLDTRPEQEN